jgi:hypothetical protein
MMRRRMVARTAVYGSAAYRGIKRGAQARQDEQLAPHPPPRPAEPAFDPIEQLKELGELREQGILTEAEFAAEKKKLLEN